MKAHCLYRFYDQADRLLYVGITMNPAGRWKQHQTDKPWWSEVAKITMASHPSREAVLEAERSVIVLERPKYNVIYNREPLLSTAGPTRAERALLLFARPAKVEQLARIFQDIVVAPPEMQGFQLRRAIGRIWEDHPPEAIDAVKSVAQGAGMAESDIREAFHGARLDRCRCPDLANCAGGNPGWYQPCNGGYHLTLSEGSGTACRACP